ncbi:hypothetical protein [Paraburkholderia sp.]|uniref:hypothetical protein n=1 Tax=Paraburkholderia sp. TaxID=1926495 RepID=UPI0039E58CD6
MENQDAFTVAEFCAAVRISKVTYYALKKRGEGPDEMHIGRRRVITAESKHKWETRMTKRAAEAEAAA